MELAGGVCMGIAVSARPGGMPTSVGVRLPVLGNADLRPCRKSAENTSTGSQLGAAQSSSFGVTGAGAWSPTGVAGDGGGGPEEAALSGLAAAVAEPSASFVFQGSIVVLP